MKNRIRTLLLAGLMALAMPAPHALAQGDGQLAPTGNQIQALEVAEQGGNVYVRIELKEPLSSPPVSFSVANPARIALDFPGTANALGRSVQDIGQGELRSANIVQAGDRTRLVLNLVKLAPYQTKLDGRNVILTLTPVSEVAAATSSAQSFANFSDSRAVAVEGSSIRDINFRRDRKSVV